MHSDNEAIHSKVDQLEAYARLARANGGKQKALYQQGDMSIYAPPEYKGSTFLGRSYPGATATFFPKRVLSTLYHETHQELDMTCSFATALVGVFRDLAIPCLKDYVKNTAAVLRILEEETGWGKRDVKKFIIKSICSHPRVPSDDKLVEISRTRFSDRLQDDLKEISGFMKLHYHWFVKMIETKCRQDSDLSKRDRLMGVCMHYLCADVENVIMREVLDHLTEKCPSIRDNCVWKFDGLLIPKDVIGPDELHEIDQLVQTALGFRVRFAIKPLDDPLPIVASTEEIRSMNEYEEWKYKFEKKWFVLSQPPTYCYVCDDGTIQDVSDVGFKHITMAEDKDMIKQWKSDPDKRSYVKRVHRPPPLEIDDSVYYNIYRGMAAESFPVPDEPVDLKLYMDHVDLLMGHCEESASYMHKLLAYKFQNPGFIWRVMVFIRSIQGVGKDLWLTFLQDIMGHSNTLAVTRVGDVCDKTSHLLEGRLLVGFSEMDAMDNQENVEELKKMITSTEILVRRKYAVEYMIRSCACFIGFSNNYNAVKIGADDRRFFCVTASGDYANDPEYHVPLVQYFQDRKVQRAVYDYYMSMDITGFDPSGERVTTETMKEMRDASMGIVDIILKKEFAVWEHIAAHGDSQDYSFRSVNKEHLRVSRQALLKSFRDAAEAMKFKDADSDLKMARLSARFHREASSRVEKFGKGRKVMVEGKSNGMKYVMFDRAAYTEYIATFEVDT